MTAWVLDLPDLPYASPNKRLHWRHRAEMNAAWRQASAVLARQAKIPTCEAIKVRLDYHPATNRKRDSDNLISGVLKPVIDGLVDAKVVADDTDDMVVRTFPSILPCRDDRRVVWALTVERLR